MLNKCPCQAEILNKWSWPPKSWTFPFSKNDFHVFHGFFSDIWPEITHKSRTRTYAGRFQKSRTNEKCRTNKKSWTNGLAKLKRSDAQKMSSIRISRKTYRLASREALGCGDLHRRLRSGSKEEWETFGESGSCNLRSQDDGSFAVLWDSSETCHLEVDPSHDSDSSCRDDRSYSCFRNFQGSLDRFGSYHSHWFRGSWSCPDQGIFFKRRSLWFDFSLLGLSFWNSCESFHRSDCNRC